jgi:hypothetical protein
MAKKQLVTPSREDATLEYLCPPIKAKDGVLSPWALIRDNRFNVDLTDGNYDKLIVIKNALSLKTDALALSYCLRTFNKYVARKGYGIFDTWNDMREKKERSSKNNVRISLNVPFDLIVSYQADAVQVYGDKDEYRKLMVKVLQDKHEIKI